MKLIIECDCGVRDELKHSEVGGIFESNKFDVYYQDRTVIGVYCKECKKSEEIAIKYYD